ncbi:MAG: hypothetical protein FWF85_09310 [Clostridiales bacterium]|nr:hypothetical protein [Clostridiales bacterium]MDR2713037.1 hypothetical protein [Clostridiales bacterium]
MSKKSFKWLGLGLALLMVSVGFIWGFSFRAEKNTDGSQPSLVDSSGSLVTGADPEPDPAIPFDSPLILAKADLPPEELKEYEEVYVFAAGDLCGLISASGKLIMKPQYNYLAILYDHAAGRQRLIMAQHSPSEGRIEYALFTPDGRQLTNFSTDSYEYNSGSYAVAFTDQGNKLVGAGSGRDWTLPASGDFGFTLNGLNYFNEGESKLYFLNEDLSSRKVLRDVEWAYALDKENSVYTVVSTKETNLHGLADEDGDLIIPCLYDSLRQGGNNQVLASGAEGFDLVLTLDNREVLRYQGNIHYALSDLAVASVRDDPQEIFLIDKSGKKTGGTFTSLWNLGEYFPGSPLSNFYLAQKRIEDWGLTDESTPSTNQPDAGENPNEDEFDEDYYNSMFGIEPDEPPAEPEEDDSLWLQMLSGESYENTILDATGKVIYEFKSNPLNWLSAFPGDRLLIERRDRKSNDIQLSFLSYDGRELLGPGAGYISITPIPDQKQHFSGYYAAARHSSGSTRSYDVIDGEGKALVKDLDSVYCCGKDRVVGVKGGKPCLVDMAGNLLFTY